MTAPQSTLDGSVAVRRRRRFPAGHPFLRPAVAQHAGLFPRYLLVFGLAGLVASAADGLEGVPAAPPAAELDTTRQDRQLREEQLRAAQVLAEAFPQNDDARYLLGLVQNAQGDSQGAIASWSRSLDLDATRADAHYDLGYASLLREDYDRAIDHLNQAVARNPGEAEYQIRLAHAHFLAGHYPETLATLDRAALKSPMAERLRAQAFHRMGRYEEARAAYAAAIQLQPDFAEAYFGLATVLARLGEPEEASRQRAKFNELKSESQTLGRRAHTDFDPLAETRRSTAGTHTDVGRVYATLGRTDQAEQWWTRAAELDPVNIECRYFLTTLFQRTGRMDEAVQMCREMIRIEPESGVHHLSLGNLERRQGRWEDAEKSYRQVLALAPGRPEGYAALAQLLLQTGRQPAEAEELAQRLVQLAPAPASYQLLAQACAARGNASAARDAIARARTLDPASPVYREFEQQLRQRFGPPEEPSRPAPQPHPAHTPPP